MIQRKKNDIHLIELRTDTGWSVFNNYQKISRSVWIMTVIMCLLFPIVSVQAQETSLVFNKSGKGSFSLTNCTIVYDDADFTVVKKIAAIFADDIEY